MESTLVTEKPRVHWDESRRQIIISLNSKKQVGLSIQEYNILQGILQGNTAAEIASDLKISPKTIETYIMRIKIKLDCDKQRKIVPLLIQCDIAKEISLFFPYKPVNVFADR